MFVCSGGERERDVCVKFGYPWVVGECGESKGSGSVWSSLGKNSINLVQCLGDLSAPDMQSPISSLGLPNIGQLDFLA